MGNNVYRLSDREREHREDRASRLRMLSRINLAMGLRFRNQAHHELVLSATSAIAAYLALLWCLKFIPPPIAAIFEVAALFLAALIGVAVYHHMRSQGSWSDRVDRLLVAYNPIDKDAYVLLQRQTTRSISLQYDYLADWLDREYTAVYTRYPSRTIAGPWRYPRHLDDGKGRRASTALTLAFTKKKLD